MRIIIACSLSLLVHGSVLADSSDDTLRFYLSKAEMVIVGQVLDHPFGFVTESGVNNYACEVQIISVIQGVRKKEERIRAKIVRFEGTGGIPRKDGKYILFLRDSRPNSPSWETADFWFGIHEYRERTAQALTRVARQMLEEARWTPLRDLTDHSDPKHIPKLISIADGLDVDVAHKALSHLSNYPPTVEISKFLRTKMTDEDPHLALHAAIITCYSGDWSGFNMLLEHASHDDASLRKRAISQLVDSRFRPHADRIVPILLERLEIETDLLERTVETLGSYPSHRVLAD